jgi:hypothetical protein
MGAKGYHLKKDYFLEWYSHLNRKGEGLLNLKGRAASMFYVRCINTGKRLRN